MQYPGSGYILEKGGRDGYGAHSSYQLSSGVPSSPHIFTIYGVTHRSSWKGGGRLHIQIYIPKNLKFHVGVKTLNWKKKLEDILAMTIYTSLVRFYSLFVGPIIYLVLDLRCHLPWVLKQSGSLRFTSGVTPVDLFTAMVGMLNRGFKTGHYIGFKVLVRVARWGPVAYIPIERGAPSLWLDKCIARCKLLDLHLKWSSI